MVGTSNQSDPEMAVDFLVFPIVPRNNSHKKPSRRSFLCFIEYYKKLYAAKYNEVNVCPSGFPETCQRSLLENIRYPFFHSPERSYG
jgi:hypothetical protein